MTDIQTTQVEQPQVEQTPVEAINQIADEARAQIEAADQVQVKRPRGRPRGSTKKRPNAKNYPQGYAQSDNASPTANANEAFPVSQFKEAIETNVGMPFAMAAQFTGVKELELSDVEQKMAGKNLAILLESGAPAIANHPQAPLWVAAAGLVGLCLGKFMVYKSCKNEQAKQEQKNQKNAQDQTNEMTGAQGAPVQLFETVSV